MLGIKFSGWLSREKAGDRGGLSPEGGWRRGLCGKGEYWALEVKNYPGWEKSSEQAAETS